MRKILLGFVLVFATLFTNVLAEDNPRAVIIFDASGSMWGQINGVTKIEIARDALKNVVKEWNPNVELGLTAYGHRSKGDCDDIESIIPVGKIDKNRVIKTVMGIKPKGKTPISRSLRKVADEIKYTEEKATIILISDGKETCDPDPCGTAKELEKEGIDFVTHVIGFNVDKKTSQQLECIADATGGEYFSAKNAVALNEAMKVIAKKVEVVEPAPKPKPVVKKLKNNLEISASEKEGGKWIESYHVIYKDEGGEAGDKATYCTSRKKKACLEQIPVGKYIIKSKYNDFKKETLFEIKADETTKVHVVMGQTGKIEISASEKEGGKWIESYHVIYKDEGGEAGDKATYCTSRKKKACLEQIPVGKYIIKSKYNDFKKETPFEIKAGEVIKVHVNFAPFHLSVKGINKCNMITYEVVSSQGQSIADAKAPARKGVDFVLPDGSYTIESSVNGVTKKTKITIGGENATKDAVVDFGGEESKGSAEGLWKTSEGKATVRLEGAKVQGSYGSDNGELTGEMTYPQRFEGFWIEDGSNTKCSEAKNGRYYWGKVVWEFDDDMCSFKGKWNYCDVKPSSQWTGTFIKSLPKEPTKEELIKADSQETPVAVKVKKEELTVVNKVSENKPQANNSKDIDKTLGQLGALLGGVTAAANSSDKPLMGLKESLKIAIPSMAETKGCYKIANSIDIVAKCDAMANDGAQKAQDAMNGITGEEQTKITPITHTDWNDDIKQKELIKIDKNLENAKLYLECINKGANMSQLKECAANNGDFTPKKDELKDLGNLLKMFGNK